MKKTNIQHLEQIFKGFLQNGYNIHEIMIAIHNVSAHGDIFKENGFDMNDEDLKALFKGFDISIEATKSK